MFTVYVCNSLARQRKPGTLPGLYRADKYEFPCFATGIVFFILNVAIAGYYQSVEQESKRYCSGISRLKVLHNNRTSWTSFSSYSYPRWNCTCASGFMQDTSIFPIFPLPEKVSLGKMYPSYRIPSSTYSKLCRSIILPLSSFQTVWLSVVFFLKNLELFSLFFRLHFSTYLFFCCLCDKFWSWKLFCGLFPDCL